MTSKVKKSVRAALVAVLLMAGVVGMLFVFRQQILPVVGRWLDVGQPPQQATYAMVLPGGAETRPFVAAAMVRRGLVHSVLVPGTVTSPSVEDGVLPSSQEMNRQVLQKRGVADDKIILLPVESSGTWNDAEALRDFLEDHPQATVAVITNDFHTRRARWVFRRVLENRAKDLLFVSAPIDAFGPGDWWLYREGMLTYLSEYCKFAVYLVLYGNKWLWLIPVAVIVLLVVVRRKLRSQGLGVRC